MNTGTKRVRLQGAMHGVFAELSEEQLDHLLHHPNLEWLEFGFKQHCTRVLKEGSKLPSRSSAESPGKTVSAAVGLNGRYDT